MLSITNYWRNATMKYYLTPIRKKGETEVTQLCLTLYNSMDCSLPGSSVRGIFQARVLEWVAISFFRGSSWPRDWTQVSCITDKFFTSRATREAAPIYIPTSSVEGFFFSTHSLSLIIGRHFSDGYPDLHEVVSHCSFYLHSSNIYWYRASFHVAVSHLYVFFGEMSI